MKLHLRDRVQVVIFAYETGVNRPRSRYQASTPQTDPCARPDHAEILVSVSLHRRGLSDGLDIHDDGVDFDLDTVSPPQPIDSALAAG